jgi:secreted trypsin-like serine protease
MRKRTTIFLLTILLLLVTFSLSQAITYGEIDGDKHPNVGALVVKFPDGEFDWVCSGTLVAPQVFLTAGHCVAWLPGAGIPNTDVSVSFDSVFDYASPGIPGEAFLHPDYGKSKSKLNDVAVVVLDEAPVGIPPAQVARVGFLDELGHRNLKDALFTNVGYGATEPAIGGGPPLFSYDGIRRYSISSFNALNKSWMHLSQNPAKDDSGTCYGDSGGPNFFGAGEEETDMVVAVTSTGDSMCRATNVVWRVDIQSAYDFLEAFGVYD